MRSIIIGTIIGIVCACRVWSQTGEIRGLVIDRAAGEPMAGATVMIESLTIGAITDADGHYQLQAPAGVHTLTIKFISYNTVVLTDVTVSAGKETEVNAAMDEALTGISEVTVYAVRKMHSEVALLSAMKSSALILSGVSAQQIAKTQDRDASEVIRRIPGISIVDNRFIIARGLAQRYNNVWINNNAVPSSEADSRAFSFDMIPSGQIDNIMIIKSPAPELPADFTGGFVKIATKNMPDVNALQVSYGLNLNSATHFTDFRHADGSATDRLGFDNGLRRLRSVVPGERFDANNATLTTDVTRNGFNNNWAIRSKRPAADQRFSLMLNRSVRTGPVQLGLVAALNHSYTHLTYHDMRNARFGVYNKQEDKPLYLYNYTDNQYAITAKTGAMLNLIALLPDNSRIELRNIFNQYGRDRYTHREGWQNISSLYNQQKDEYYYNSRGTYTGQLSGTHERAENSKLDWTIGYSYANKNQPDRRQVDLEEDTGGYGMNNIVRDFNRLNEHMYSAAANYHHTLRLGTLAPTLKAGLYAEYRTRRYDTRYFLYKLNPLNLPPGFEYLDVATEMMRPEYFDADKLFIADASNKTNNYAGTDLLACGYLAFNLPLGKFNIYAGVRYENNAMRLTNYTTLSTDATETLDYKQPDFFPSANVTYHFDKRHLLRFAFGKSINRQEFREVSPSTYYDFDLFSFVRGNKLLQPAYIQNLDLRYEIYPSSGELISLALFYKRFTNPIEWTYIDAGGSYTFTFENADKANNYGIELDLKKSLDFVGMPDFSLAFNGALIKSIVIFEHNSLEHNRPMQGQSPYLVNTGLFYQRGNLNAALMYNVIGKRIVGIGRSDNSQGGTIDNNVPDMYETPRHAVDLSASYKFGKHVELSAGIRDILMQPLTFKQYPEFIDEAGNVCRREQTTKEYRPGRHFSLTLKINL